VNISIAIEKFDPGVGGAERYCWDLAHYLAGQGHGIVIICRKGKAPAHGSIRLRCVGTIAFPQFLRHLSFALMHFLTARRLEGYRHFCVGNTFFMDFYQPHGGSHRAWFLRETLMFGQPFRTVRRLMMRMSPKDMVQRAMEWWIFSVVKPQVIAISQMVASDITRFFPFPKDRIHLVPNGVNIRRYHPGNREYREEIRRRYRIGNEEYVFLFVAQNPRLKGYHILVEACRTLAPRPFRVLVVGPCGDWMESEAMGLGDRMIFAGRVDDLHKVYPACDCLVHPTFYDACSLVVLESLASGTPVITTSANGAGMFIEKGSGTVIKPGDVPALVSAMKDAMEAGRKEAVICGMLRDHTEVFARVEELMTRYEH
jgi:UDP-glucose:(heptosyl)LPS alpha-1,3-glucosyltransferase